jgi:hypothetical protein
LEILSLPHTLGVKVIRWQVVDGNVPDNSVLERLYSNWIIIYFHEGRAIALAVSRWPASPGSRLGLVKWNVVDKVALELVFSDYFGIPCQSSFHQILHYLNHPGPLQ